MYGDAVRAELPDLVDAHDVRTDQLRRGLALAEEARDEQVVAEHARLEQLDGRVLAACPCRSPRRPPPSPRAREGGGSRTGPP